MFEYLKKIIADSTGNPRSNVFIAVLASVSLCLGFLFSTGALIYGVNISEGVILGLAAIIAGLAGHNYRVAKQEKKDDVE